MKTRFVVSVTLPASRWQSDPVRSRAVLLSLAQAADSTDPDWQYLQQAIRQAAAGDGSIDAALGLNVDRGQRSWATTQKQRLRDELITSAVADEMSSRRIGEWAASEAVGKQLQEFWDGHWQTWRSSPAPPHTAGAREGLLDSICRAMPAKAPPFTPARVLDAYKRSAGTSASSGTSGSSDILRQSMTMWNPVSNRGQLDGGSS